MLFRLSQAARREGGSALISAIMVSAIVLTLGVTSLAISVHTNDVSGYDRARAQAVHAADAGINEVIQRFATDFNNAGGCMTSPSTPLQLTDGGQKIAKFRYQVEPRTSPPDPSCTSDERIIRSWGYAPQSARSVRQLEVLVKVTPIAGFGYTLFAGDATGTLDIKNNAVVDGQIYAQTLNTNWNNMTQSGGGLTSPGSITTKNNDSYGGDIVAGTSVSIGQNVTVQGAVRAATGSVSLGGGTCTVKSTVRAGTTIGGSCTTGGLVPGSPSAVPPTVPMPTFTYNPSNYTNPSPTAFTSVSTANTFFGTPVGTGLAGTFYITDPLSTSLTPKVVDLTTPWRIVGPLTIITASTGVAGNVPPKIRTSGSWTTTCTCQFVLVSQGTASDAISTDKKLNLPPTVSALLFTPGGVLINDKVEQLTGSIYATAISIKNDMQIAYSSDLSSHPPVGFSFPTSSVTQWEPTVKNWREISPGTLPAGSL